MNIEIIYSVIGIVILVVIIVLTFRSSNIQKPRDTTEKKAQIVAQYHQEMKDALAGLEDDKQKRLSTKRELLKKFNDELSRNIFFNADEIRAIILKLSQES